MELQLRAPLAPSPSHDIVPQVPQVATNLSWETSRLQHNNKKAKIMVSVVMAAMANLSHLQTQSTM